MGRRRISTSLMVVVLASPAGLAGCAATSTYGTGEAPEVALFREMTGGLLSREKKDPIDYEPRAPLVMPPNAKQLPPPVETAAAADPNWPIDPSERVVASATDAENPQDVVNQAEYRRLRPLADAMPETPRSTTAAQDDLSIERAERYKFIHQAKQQNEQFSKALADANGLSHDERRYLTDPPLAYRQPSDTAPTGEVETGVKKRGFWRRLFGS